MEATGIVRSRETISQTGVAWTGEAGRSELRCSGSTYQLVDGTAGAFCAPPSPLGALSGGSAAVIDVQQSGKQPSVMRSKV